MPGPTRHDRKRAGPYTKNKRPQSSHDRLSLFARIKRFIWGGRQSEDQEADEHDASAETHEPSMPREAANSRYSLGIASPFADASLAVPMTASPNETLRNFFKEKGDRKLSNMEVYGVLNLIGQAVCRNESLVDFNHLLSDLSDETISMPASQPDTRPKQSRSSFNTSGQRPSLFAEPNGRVLPECAKSPRIRLSYGPKSAAQDAPVYPIAAASPAPRLERRQTELSHTASVILDIIGDDQFAPRRSSQRRSTEPVMPISTSTPTIGERPHRPPPNPVEQPLLFSQPSTSTPKSELPTCCQVNEEETQPPCRLFEPKSGNVMRQIEDISREYVFDEPAKANGPLTLSADDFSRLKEYESFFVF